MPKDNSFINKLQDQVVDLESRVRKLENIFFLGSSMLSTPAIPPSALHIDLEPLYIKAVKTVQKYDRASASILQRKLSVGYATAARLLDMLEERGVVGPADGSHPRVVLIPKK